MVVPFLQAPPWERLVRLRRLYLPPLMTEPSSTVRPSPTFSSTCFCRLVDRLTFGERTAATLDALHNVVDVVEVLPHKQSDAWVFRTRRCWTTDRDVVDEGLGDLKDLSL